VRGGALAPAATDARPVRRRPVTRRYCARDRGRLPSLAGWV